MSAACICHCSGAFLTNVNRLLASLAHCHINRHLSQTRKILLTSSLGQFLGVGAGAAQTKKWPFLRIYDCPNSLGERKPNSQHASSSPISFMEHLRNVMRKSSIRRVEMIMDGLTADIVYNVFWLCPRPTVNCCSRSTKI